MLPTHLDHGHITTRIPLVLKNGKRYWAFVAILFSVQCISTIFTSFLGQPLPHDATVTDLLYGHSVTVYLFQFLTFQANSIFAIALALYNSIILANFLGYEVISDLSSILKRLVFYGIRLSGVIGLRILLGYLFSRGTGFAYPALFFNDAIHETTSGLSVIILYFIARRAFAVIEDESPGPFKSIPFSLIMWSPNVFHGSIFFWSFSTVTIAGIQGVILLLLDGRPSATVNSPTSKATPQISSRSFRLFSMVRTFLILCSVFMAINLVHSVIYHFEHNVHTRAANNLPEPVLTDFLLLSYPRRSNSTILSSTLQSYVPSLGGRFKAHVYTTANLASHTAFTDAQNKYRGHVGLDFYQDAEAAPLNLSRLVIPGYLPEKQTFDLYAALSWAEQNIPNDSTRYLGIMEDDFEWCTNGLEELKAIIYEVELQELALASRDRFCGIFVATGGSGLLVRPSVLGLLRDALQKYAFDLNPDVILQDCLRGELSLCNKCKLSASRRLLLRHTGAVESTYRGRVYPEDRWQCGWRQPFNGKLGIWVP